MGGPAVVVPVLEDPVARRVSPALVRHVARERDLEDRVEGLGAEIEDAPLPRRVGRAAVRQDSVALEGQVPVERSPRRVRDDGPP